MDKIYIFGHKNPDTDSVTAAITLSYLKNIKRKNSTVPCVLGSINNETKFVLDYFKVDKPNYLNDTKIQVKDLRYKKNCFLKETDTLNTLYNFMKDQNITGVPIVDDYGRIKGLVTTKDLVNVIINPNYDYINTKYDEILNIIKGKQVCKFNDNINGRLIISAYNSDEFNEHAEISNNNILIVGNRPNLIKLAIENKALLLIIVGTKELDEDIINLASKNKINIITTNQHSLYVSRMVILSNYIRNIVDNTRVILDENMYYNDLQVLFDKYKFTNYPVISKNKKVLGLLRRPDITSKINKKQVIMVDHNEYNQSVDGIEEAEILEIVDHHKIGNINSSMPINMRNMAVGSTNTIIYEMYKEQKIAIPKEIAGLMMSGIISDTLMFHSPTTTEMDKKAVKELSQICKVEPVSFSRKMFEAASKLEGKTIEEIVMNDFKTFNVGKTKFGIGQVMATNYEIILNDKEKYLEAIERIKKENGFDVICLVITDMINSNSYILYNESSKMIFETCLKIDNLYEGYMLKGVVSRKKQIIPLIMEELK